MALDEVLLNAVAADGSLPVVRLYRWQPAAVSLGYFQRGTRTVNLAACRRMGVDVVRRMTGGRAVLHDCEMTYAVMAGLRRKPFSDRVLDNYRAIAEILRQTIESFGLPVTLVPGCRKSSAEGVQHSACFTAPSSFELLCHGCKIAGSAQKRQGEFFLQHGSIPVELDPVKLFCLLDTVGRLSPEDGGRKLMESVGWINRWVRPISVDELEDRFLSCFGQTLGVEFEPQPPTAEEWQASRRLAAERYHNHAWTFHAC